MLLKFWQLEKEKYFRYEICLVKLSSRFVDHWKSLIIYHGLLRVTGTNKMAKKKLSWIQDRSCKTLSKIRNIKNCEMTKQMNNKLLLRSRYARVRKRSMRWILLYYWILDLIDRWLIFEMARCSSSNWTCN